MALGESRASAGLAHGVMKAAADLCIYDTIFVFLYSTFGTEKHDPGLGLQSWQRNIYLNASVFLH